jgi:2-hydroxy-3-oxopropionate reductase
VDATVLANVGFLGTGLMGAPMAANLVKSGYRVMVWNRTQSKTDHLARLGARVAQSPGEAVSEADIVVSILENGPVVEQVIFGSGAVEHIRPGSLVVDMSSIPPATARDHARRLRARSVGHLDAPVSGGPYGAEAGSLAIMVGGDEADFARAASILRVFGSATHVGPSGTGQLAKLGSQIILGAALGAIAEALLLASAGGANPVQARLAWSGGFADSKVLQIHGQRMLNRDFVPGGHARTHLKDLDSALAAAKEHDLDLPVTSLAHTLLAALCAQGGGDYDNSALLLELERRNRPHKLTNAPDRVP